MVAPLQGYLDGYCVKQDVVRQFVAMPLGSGYPAEEQATGEAEYDGCLRILVCPMKLEVFERRFSKLTWDEYWGIGAAKKRLCYCRPMEVAHGSRIWQHLYADPYELCLFLRLLYQCTPYILLSEYGDEQGIPL